MNKIYFPVYSILEKEILELTSIIHFNDEQIKVYSIKIADLIVRISVEIEAIAKDIYREENKCDPETPGKCFDWMEQNWKISKKKLFLINPYFHFKRYFNPYINPFNYKNNSEDDFYSQYNAIKHDRGKNLHKGNVNVLIRSIAALYILNLYYDNKKQVLSEKYSVSNVNNSYGSNLFSYGVYPYEKEKLYSCYEDILEEDCIYKIVKSETEYCFTIAYYKEGCLKKDRVIMFNEHFQALAKKNYGKKIRYIEDSSNIQNVSLKAYFDGILKKLDSSKLEYIMGDIMPDSYYAVVNK
ncbi:MAG: hypothetical protein ACI35S_09780 [Anaeroplasma sp.]